jgi:hypothetical protein
MTNKREKAIQLRAYAKWNPENDPEKISDLEVVQAGIDEGRLVQLGRAVVHKIRTDEPIERTRDRFKGVKLGRALIDAGSYGPIKPGATIGDGCFVASSDIDGDSVITESTIICSTVTCSSIDESALQHIEVIDSHILGSQLSNKASERYHVPIDKSFVSLCNLTNTPVLDATLINITGSSGGKIIQGGPFYDAVLTSIGESLFVEHIE